jgi:hypothetical protein
MMEFSESTRENEQITDNCIFEAEEHQILPYQTPPAKLSGPIELKFCMGIHRRVLFEIAEAILEIAPQG